MVEDNSNKKRTNKNTNPSYTVRGDILVYKNEIVVKIKLKVLFNKSGKMNLKIFNLCNEDVFF